jgi:hypothetical protein
MQFPNFQISKFPNSIVSSSVSQLALSFRLSNTVKPGAFYPGSNYFRSDGLADGRIQIFPGRIYQSGEKSEI